MFVCRGAEHIGVEYLSACLKKAGHITELLFDPGFDDTFYFKISILKYFNNWSRLIKRVKDFSPDVLAISSVSNTYPYICKFIREIKKHHNCYTVIGGIHSTAIPEYVIREGLFDAVCIGEGERAFVKLLNYLEEGEVPTSLQNFYFMKEKEIIKNPLHPLVENLDDLPFPDKELFYKCGVFSSTLMVASGRGCPFSCGFCVNDKLKVIYKNLGHHIRRYSPERMIEEIKYFTLRYPIKRINFQDDIFTMDVKWLSRFNNLYTRSINLPFQCNTHPLFVNDDIGRLLRTSNCISVCMGIQTAVQDKRKELLGRFETNWDIKSAVDILKKNRLSVCLEYIFGLPDETVEDIKENITFNYKLKPNNTSTFIFYPFPGTQLLDNLQRTNKINEKNLNNVYMGKGSYHYTSFIELSEKLVSETTASLFPILSKVPPGLGFNIINFFSCRCLQWLVKLLQVLFLPVNNPFQFEERAKNYLKMLYPFKRN
ncbi:MAG: B12-binding domain-containing radical SAM protein [Elusimicrobia bacterium]|nr:B12-binding domain-containing radical SAM protein [Elusimicrobiota bacterium]